MPTNVTNAAETNVITTSQMSRVREIDFVERFGGSILPGLIEALGVTRKIPMQEGTTLYVYKTTGTLQDGDVPEGEIIPLSQYQRTKTAVGEITLMKHRKATTAEAIKKSGRQEAVTETDKKMISDLQKKIRTQFFTTIAGFDGTVVGDTTLQAVLAGTWAQLQVLFENDSIEAVHFINPLTIGDYLKTATISTQTAFGMRYIEDFLGLGTVIMTSAVPKGKVISTAKENIIMYYLNMAGGDLSTEFNLTTDESGYIGVTTYLTQNRAQTEMLAMWGVTFLVEYADGVVYGQIDSTPTLQSITVASEAGTASGDTKITASGYSLGTGESWKYKVGTAATDVAYGQKLGSGWTAWNGTADITAATGKVLTLAAVDAQGRAQAEGHVTVTAHA